MFFKDGDILTLDHWGYNRVKMLKAVEHLVRKQGGRIKPVQFASGYVKDRHCESARPIKTVLTSQTSFMLNGVYYSIILDDNPFFPHYFIKTPVMRKGMKSVYSKDACATEIAQPVAYDCMLTRVCTNDEALAVARYLVNYVTAQPCCGIYRDMHKKRVANTYDGGWHTEYVYEPERFETINW